MDILNQIILLEAAPNTIVGNIVVTTGAFILLLFLIKRFAWKQITSIFEARAKKINDDIDAAEEAHKTATDLVKKKESELAGSRTEAAQIIQTANDTAAQNKAKVVEATNQEVAALKARAKAEIDQEKKDALSSVKSDVAGISIQIAEKLVGKSLDVKSQSDLIDAYLEKFGSQETNK